jgi:hypothetical protein
VPLGNGALSEFLPRRQFVQQGQKKAQISLNSSQIPKEYPDFVSTLRALGAVAQTMAWVGQQTVWTQPPHTNNTALLTLYRSRHNDSHEPAERTRP